MENPRRRTLPTHANGSPANVHALAPGEGRIGAPLQRQIENMAKSRGSGTSGRLYLLLSM